MIKISEYTLEELILVSLDSVLRKIKKCSYSNLVKECFTLFPEEFSLAEIPAWPDSLKLDRPLRQLRERGLIKGNPNTYYSLTKFGENLVQKIRQKVPSDKIKDDTYKTTRSPALQLFEKVKNSEDFKKFSKNKSHFKPSNMKIRGLVGFTLETPKRRVLSYLNYLHGQAINSQAKMLAEYFEKYISYFKKSDN